MGRYADEVPPGEVVHHVPTDRARIMLKILDDFPTQQFLGPLIVNRPEFPSMSEPEAARRPQTGIPDGVQVATGDISSEGWQPVPADGEVCSEIEINNLRQKAAIRLGPIRLTFAERFPFGPPASQFQGSFLRSADRTTLDPPHHMPPWAALQAGMLALQSSGLSPPQSLRRIETLRSERCPPGPWHLDIRDTRLTPGSLKISSRR